MRFLAFLSYLLVTFLVQAAEGVPIFENQISGIFNRKCGKCHGAKVQKGGLDLSTMKGIYQGGESEESVLGEGLKDSLLWKMISR